MQLVWCDLGKAEGFLARCFGVSEDRSPVFDEHEIERGFDWREGWAFPNTSDDFCASWDLHNRELFPPSLLDKFGLEDEPFGSWV